ncbi:hypothetical protein X805_01380 [Sphaerotilus natans subsp. natans DSM 6575]|uniref:Uncharacterized protein n=1 Tax=Sphaerotilus natans subsp. natans DSM 6575 TaxID=1286631 RepID=A0A059KS22_9BURK|nr:hypothetical protein X805_01380 [Sphaerotilus natans subsp. natans DSM 6575]
MLSEHPVAGRDQHHGGPAGRDRAVHWACRDQVIGLEALGLLTSLRVGQGAPRCCTECASTNRVRPPGSPDGTVRAAVFPSFIP